MNAIRSGGATALALLIAACGERQNATDNREAVPDGPQTQGSHPVAAVYSGTGTVKSIAGDQVAIAHGPIKGIGWPAMTMTFTAPGDTAAGVKVGDRVDFSFRKNGGAYVLTLAKPR